MNENSRSKNKGSHYVQNKVSESIVIAKEMDKEDIEILDLEKQISNIVSKIKLWNGL